MSEINFSGWYYKYNSTTTSVESRKECCIDDGRPLAERIYAFICRWKTVSFAELSKQFKEDFTTGEMALCAGEQHSNIILWDNMTQSACDAMRLLLENNLIAPTPTTVLVYAMDGVVPSFPIVKRAINYKSPHWLPVVFNPVTPGCNQ